MKTIISLFIFLSIGCATSSAQGRYGETLPIQTICPCEMAHFFKNRQCIDVPSRPFGMSSSSFHAMPVSTYASQDFHFFRRHKRKTKVNYPKKSHIIPVCGT